MNDSVVNWMSLTVEEIKALNDRDLAELDDKVHAFLYYNHNHISALDLAYLESINRLCRDITEARTLKRAWENKYPELIQDIENHQLPTPEQLSGFHELCAKHGLKVNYGQGWGVDIRGVHMTVNYVSKKQWKSNNPTLRQDYPEFMAEIDRLNAEWSANNAR